MDEQLANSMKNRLRKVSCQWVKDLSQRTGKKPVTVRATFDPKNQRFNADIFRSALSYIKEKSNEKNKLTQEAKQIINNQ